MKALLATIVLLLAIVYPNEMSPVITTWTVFALCGAILLGCLYLTFGGKTFVFIGEVIGKCLAPFCNSLGICIFEDEDEDEEADFQINVGGWGLLNFILMLIGQFWILAFAYLSVNLIVQAMLKYIKAYTKQLNVPTEV
jgi:hypothetical protein